MDNPNLKDSFGIHSTNKSQMEKEKKSTSDSSFCYSTSSYLNKHDYSNEHKNKSSDSNPLITESKNCNFLLNSETGIKCNESIDYDIVIKQFDDLISELSNSRNSNKKYSITSSLFDIVQENIKDNMQNLKENFFKSCEENYENDSVSHREECSSGSRKIASEDKIYPTSNGVNDFRKEEYKLGCIDISNKHLDQNSTVGTTGSISWIDSNLWHLENEKQSCQFQKFGNHKDVHLDALMVSSKGTCFNLPQPATDNFEHCDVINNPMFYSVQIAKKKDINYSVSKTHMKQDYTRLPRSEAYFKERNICNPNFEAFKISGSALLEKSPRASRSSISKYVLPNKCFVVKLFIETKASHLGPFPFEIYPKMSLRLLKLKVEQEHCINISSQRWILGKCFAIDNDKSLVDYNVMPGSSIILYVDNNKKNSYDTTKKEFCGQRSNTHINHKLINNNTTIQEKERNVVFDSLNKNSKHREPRELIRKDSLDFKSIHSCPEIENQFSGKLEKQGSINNSMDNIDKEQIINSQLYKDVTCDKIVSPVIKRKGLKKSTEIKKREKTKIIIPEMTNIPTDNYEEKSISDKYNLNCYLYEDDSLKGKTKSFSKNNLSNSVQIQTANENKSEQSQVMPVNYALNAHHCSDSDILLQYNKEILAENSFSAFNTLEARSASSSSEIIIPAENYKKFPLNVISKKDEFPKTSCFNLIQLKDTGTLSHVHKENDDINIFNSSSNIARSLDYEEVFPIDKAKGLILCDTYIPAKLEKAKNFHNKVVGKTSSDKHSGNEEGNDKDSSRVISRVLNMKDPFPVKEPENLIQPNIYDSQEMETVEDSHNKIVPEGTNNVCKPKRSVTSLIKKLSLTRKVKSAVGSSSFDNMSSNEILRDEITDEKTSEQLPTLNSNQSSYSNIHIEISPQNLDITPVKDESTEECKDDNSLVDPTVHHLESVKNFELLLEIENMDLVENTMSFMCPVCFDEFESGQGVILHDCLHTFCRDCLANSISYAEGAAVKCPYRDDFYSCQSHLQQREIKALVAEDVYERYLQRSIITAEGLEERSFHCRTPDCTGWCVYDNAINVFHCPVCFHYNCLNCQAIHEGLNCRQYQDKLKLQQKVDQDAQKTLDLLNRMIENGKALRCPKCDLILMKKWGCDWLKCSICQTEICWITKGPRWGPGGQGDTSGGCRCGVNGVKCHPSCTYCH